MQQFVTALLATTGAAVLIVLVSVFVVPLFTRRPRNNRRNAGR